MLLNVLPIKRQVTLSSNQVQILNTSFCFVLCLPFQERDTTHTALTLILFTDPGVLAN